MEKAKETGTDQELMRSMKVSKAVAAMAIPSVISSWNNSDHVTNNTGLYPDRKQAFRHFLVRKKIGRASCRERV